MRSADRRGLGDLGEELVVGLEVLEPVDEQFEGRGAAALAILLQPGEHPAQLEDLLHLPAVERLGARVFRVNVAFDDQPIDRRIAGNIDVVSAESVLDFVLRVDPGATARVIEVDRRGPAERLP